MPVVSWEADGFRPDDDDGIVRDVESLIDDDDELESLLDEFEDLWTEND